jgi:hypothetical protein
MAGRMRDGTVIGVVSARVKEKYAALRVISAQYPHI